MHSCRACGSTNIESFLNLGDLPPAGSLSDKPQLSNTYPLELFFCHNCKLIQSPAIIDLFSIYSKYFFSSSTVPFLQEHFKNYAIWIKNNYSPQKVLEIGCNDGILLSELTKQNIEAIGVDPSHNLIKICESKNLSAINSFFNISTAENVLTKFGKVDLITSSNCFAHIDDYYNCLNAAKIVLSDNGYLCLEVMYSLDMLEKLQWDAIYHEHLCYFSLSSIKNLLSLYGFNIVDVSRNNMHAGTLRVIATQNTQIMPSDAVNKLLKLEKNCNLNEFSTWQFFADKVLKQIEQTKVYLYNLSQYNQIWGYGAGGRGSMWYNKCDMKYLQYILDDSALRAGKYLPNINIPIVLPAILQVSKPNYIFVSAWNYVDSIVNRFSDYNINWIVPTPELTIYNNKSLVD